MSTTDQNPAFAYWKQNLIVLWVVQVFSQMSYGLALPFTAFYLRELGLSDPNEVKLWVGLLTMAPGLTMAIFAPVWGKLSDKYGRKLMVMRSQYASGVILTLMGLVPNPAWFLITRVVQGTVTGTVVAASTFVAANTPKDKMGRALGFLSSANFIGYSLGPAVGGFLAGWLGYRPTFWISGAMAILAGIAVTFLIREPGFSKAERAKIVNSAVSSGDVRNLPFTFKDAMQAAGLILLVLFFFRFSSTLFSPYLALHLENLLGGSGVLRATGLVNMLFSIFSALAGMTLPRFAERVGNVRFTLRLYLAGALTLLLIILLPSFIPFAVLYVVYGFCIGAIEPILTSVMAERVEANHRGALLGYNALLNNLGWFFAPLAASFVSIRWDIPAIFYLLLALQVFSSLLVYRLMRTSSQEAKL
jgi:DHA1 family multidrug resistance protein-like MFS transporter